MQILNFFSGRAESGFADWDTGCPHKVILTLNPSVESDAAEIETASGWLSQPGRRGAAKRKIHDATGQVEFAFESDADAFEFACSFGSHGRRA
ncbi:hypothetical protein [Brevundimonas sp. SGAir0440]|uniref:hypothetical protein n=1 Tax=Brevundimonas sp. SGAir0440 TaxID=2579977 RepID=UPI0010CCD631|nr:hypothetical protein [Brevundimonas sp. SGAir0440]QCQ97763.1 hypothetical protein E7T10_03300 [Brevundimonas sp. SGAir0440]